MLVNENKACDTAPATVAATWKEPVCELAAMAGEVATPVLSVMPVEGTAEPNPGPVAGGVNVTVAPATALPNESRTAAFSGNGKAVLTGVVCPVPDIALMLRDGDGVIWNELLLPDNVAAFATNRYVPLTLTLRSLNTA
jgi:hypothetical protein